MALKLARRESVLVLDLLDRPAWVDAEVEHTVIRVETLAQVTLFQQLAVEIFEESCHTPQAN